MQKRRVELRYKFAFYALGLVVAFILALVNSPFAGEAFALVAGLLGGDAISGNMKS